jgi:hypothetical protein
VDVESVAKAGDTMTGALTLPSSGTFTANQAAREIDIGGPHCGRLTYVSATQIKFSPYQGDRVRINGVIYPIPSAGITAANTGVYVNGIAGQNLAASQSYFVYVFNNAGTLTIDFGTGGRVTSTTAGNVGTEIKAGNDAYSLIGFIYTNASGQFVDTNIARWVVSWFNRRSISCDGAASGSISTSSTAFIEVSSGSRVNFLAWGDEAITMNLIMSANNTGGSTAYVAGQIGLDGISSIQITINPLVTLASASYGWLTGSKSTTAVEGLHYITPCALVQSGSFAVNGAVSVTIRG